MLVRDIDVTQAVTLPVDPAKRGLRGAVTTNTSDERQTQGRGLLQTAGDSAVDSEHDPDRRCRSRPRISDFTSVRIPTYAHFAC